MVASVNKRHRKPEEQSRMGHWEIQATSGTRHRTKTNKSKKTNFRGY